ncbi:hypothetical protein SOVF_078910 [Spinacia oleracea]|nr:hypothetical protein SOVF_078910 [Spinacia oleracea]
MGRGKIEMKRIENRTNRQEQMLQTDNGSMYRWLMGGGQLHEQQQQQQQHQQQHQQLMGQMPFIYGGEDQQPSSSTVLQLATSSSSPHQFYPYRLQPTHPNLQDYGKSSIIIVVYPVFINGFIRSSKKVYSDLY